MKNRINKNLIFIALIAVLSTTVFITYIYYNLFQKRVRNDLEVSLDLLRNTHYFENESIDPGTIDLKTDIEDLRVTWIKEDGTVLYDNDNTADELENHLNRSEIADALKYGKGESVRRSDTMSVNTFYYALRLSNGTILRVASEAASVFSFFSTVAPAVLLIILAVIMACVILSQLLTSQIIRPIEKVAENIDSHSGEVPYEELNPFISKIRKQHEEILENVKIRQEFTANVSHELKTPLTSISGYADLIEFKSADDEERRHFAIEIRQNAKRLLTLIEDILYLSKLDAGGNQTVFKKVDLYALSEKCISELSISASEKEVKVSLSGIHAYVNGDEEMLYEMIENLLQNAIRYNVHGGTVEISINTEKEKAIFSIADSGIGIPEKDQEKVFERFYRVDKSRSKKTGGTGLGLAIVKHIAEIHDASIFLQSQPGKGTLIRITFKSVL